MTFPIFADSKTLDKFLAAVEMLATARVATQQFLSDDPKDFTSFFGEIDRKRYAKLERTRNKSPYHELVYLIGSIEHGQQSHEELQKRYATLAAVPQYIELFRQQPDHVLYNSVFKPINEKMRLKKDNESLVGEVERLKRQLARRDKTISKQKNTIRDLEHTRDELVEEIETLETIAGDLELKIKIAADKDRLERIDAILREALEVLNEPMEMQLVKS